MTDPRLTQIADLLAEILDGTPPEFLGDTVEDLAIVDGDEGIIRMAYTIKRRWLKRGVELSRLGQWTEQPDIDEDRDVFPVLDGEIELMEEPDAS